MLTIIILLTLLPALNGLINLWLLRTPPLAGGCPKIAILIPARDEAAGIRACVEAALASTGVDLEIIVLDDHSEDATAAIVTALAVNDPRVRIALAPELPPGWKGKPHACHILSTLTERPYLFFVDADVRLDPTAASRLLPRNGVELVSAVPRQIVPSLIEASVVPMINGLIYGYLPVGIMRRSNSAAFAAACGQMLMVRADAYRQVGGHAAVATFMHDGMQLARRFRQHGFRTDLVAGASLAQCRMYDTAAALFAGFAKNATEGMARPVALPIWTILLLGGQIMPFVLLLFSGTATLGLLAALALLIAARVGQAYACREPWRAVVLYPVGVLLTLWIQWHALFRYRRGGQVEWRGRSYAPRL
jgi:hypothetical protein